MSVDLHTHTRFFHGFPGRPTKFDPIGAGLVALFGRMRGLDGVALTNHDYFSDFESVSTGLTFIPGVEVTTTQSHALVIGPEPPTRTTPGRLTPQEVVAIGHEADCAVVLAHPYRWGQIHGCSADFDAVEINGKHPHTMARVRVLADTLDLPIVGGSDAHFPFEVGRAFTEIDVNMLTPASVVEAIREGRVEPRIRDNRWNRLIQTGYRYLHRYGRR